MIFLNLAFIKGELTQNTIEYLNEGFKSKLFEPDSDIGFNGVGFKNFDKLKDFLNNEVKSYDKNFLESGGSRRVNAQTIENLYKAFKSDTPLYVDTDKLYRLMLLSSNLVFTPNEKIFLTVMFENPYEVWNAEEIVQYAKESYDLDLNKSKVEETLDRHIEKNKEIEVFVISSVQNGIKYYQIHFTNLIVYIRNFENIKSQI